MNSLPVPTLLAAAGLVGFASTVQAAKHTWTGHARSSNWSQTDNWLEGPPALDELDIELSFPETIGSKKPTNDIGTFTVRRIAFSGDGYFVLGGNGKNLIKIEPYSRGIFAGVGLTSDRGTNRLYMSAEIQSDLTIAVSGPNTILAVNAINESSVGGPKGVTKTGDGTLLFDGDGHNLYQGPTTVRSGLLRLARTPGHTAIQGNLIIGSRPLPLGAVVRLEADDQIADGAAVAIYPYSQWQLNGFHERVLRVAMDTGSVSTKALVGGTVGTLALGGDGTAYDISASAPSDGSARSEVTGRVSLEGQTRHVIAEQGELLLGAQIVNPLPPGGDPLAGLLITGPGEVWLGGGSTYDGPTTLANGRTVVSEPGSFGTSVSPTIVKNGATLILNGNQLANAGLKTNRFELEELVLQDLGAQQGPAPKLANWVNAEWTGPVTLVGQPLIEVNGTVGQPAKAALIDLQGPISGDGGLTKAGFGRLQFSGTQVNTYAQPTFVLRGELRLHKSNPRGLLAPVALPGDVFIGAHQGTAEVVSDRGGHVADTSNVVLLDDEAQFSATGPEVIHSLSGQGGLVSNNGGELVIQQTVGNPTWDRVSYKGYFFPSQDHPIVKSGAGTLIIDTPFVQNFQFFNGAGPIRVDEGAFVVNGNLPSSVLVTGGVLAGKGGRAYGVEMTGGELHPGDDWNGNPNPTYGQLDFWNFQIGPNAKFFAQLVTPANYTRLRVMSPFGGNPIQLQQAQLQLSLPAQAEVLDTYVLIEPGANYVTQGQFLNYPQGTTLPVAGKVGVLSYEAGPNHNAVTLLVLPPFSPVSNPRLTLPKIDLDLTGHIRQFRFEASDSRFAGRRFRVEFRAGLEDRLRWLHLGEVLADANGRVEVFDPEANQDGTRFYRLVALEP